MFLKRIENCGVTLVVLGGSRILSKEGKYIVDNEYETKTLTLRSLSNLSSLCLNYELC